MKTVIGSDLAHRSRERVKDLGEVFTPAAYVENMLEAIAKGSSSIWSDDSINFFEPSCGHGNIVLPIYKRRLEAFFQKAISNNYKNPELYSVANSLNTLWAIDVDSRNIKECKARILEQTLTFLIEKRKGSSVFQQVNKNKEFFAHVLCSINWHIQENEALSSLSEPDNAKSKAALTRTGTKWFSKNGHKEIDFDISWSFYFIESTKDKIVPFEFLRASKFLSGVLNGTPKVTEDYDFANNLFSKCFNEDSKNTRVRARV